MTTWLCVKKLTKRQIRRKHIGVHLQPQFRSFLSKTKPKFLYLQAGVAPSKNQKKLQKNTLGSLQPYVARATCGLHVAPPLVNKKSWRST